MTTWTPPNEGWDPWSMPEYWVSRCYRCGHFVYWNDDAHGASWCHLHYDGFRITHLAEPGAASPFPACLLIQEEP